MREDDEEAPEEELDDAIEPVFKHGSVVRGTNGCGMYCHLIVTGQHRGHVRYVDGEGATPFGAPFGGTTAAQASPTGPPTGQPTRSGSTPRTEHPYG
ncbi:hypothetical protein ACFYS8_36210 [Kitasatospora sp. NPDC004615]|uniref:hypothetical protein n=1 Tax=Kitasatospora sp. NPDC004615 TaxID=3364017 RepID=UPI003675EF15